MTHILFVTETPAFQGGAERYIHDLAQRLRLRGIPSTLLYNPLRTLDVAFVKPFEGAFPALDPPSQLRRGSYDLIYLHQWPGAGMPRALASTGIPVVRFLHDHRLFCLRGHKMTLSGKTCLRVVSPACYFHCGPFAFIGRKPTITTLARLREEQQANQRLGALVVASSYMKAHAEAHGFPKEKVHKVPLYVDPPSPSSEPLTRDLNHILYVGALTRGKGLHVLLEAMKMLPKEVRLTVVGSGPQEPWFKKRAIPGRVRFLGRLDRAAVEKLLKEVSVLVIPSIQPETFSLVGPEALRHGTPVIASLVGGVGEWLKDGLTGLAVKPGDAEDLASAIKRLLSNPDLARNLGEAGRRFVLENLTPRRHLDALLALFKCLGGQKG